MPRNKKPSSRMPARKPAAPSRARATSPTGGPWSLLWQHWVEQPAGTLLDRWLSANLSKLVPAPGAHAALVARLHKAVAYQQLICALAHQFENRSSAINWADWDRRWTPADVARLSVGQVEQWLSLRLNPEASATVNTAPGHEQRVQCLQAFRQHAATDPAALALWHGFRPAWLPALAARASLSGWSAAEREAFQRAQSTQPPLWLRVQSDLATAEICASLAQDGVLVEQRPEGLCAHGGKSIHGSTLYKQGAIEIQDLASQALAAQVAVTPGQKVWDVCAGAGGKSLAIARALENKGMLLATDLHEYKLQELKRRAKRADVFNIRSFTWDASAPLKLPREIAQQQGFDWVFVDAPCSASGTWRRNPDARWRYTDADTHSLVQLQQKILTAAVPALRRGGKLVYATCSWDVRENEQQVDWLLAQCPSLSRESMAMVGCPAQDADTMFVAVLKKA